MRSEDEQMSQQGLAMMKYVFISLGLTTLASAASGASGEDLSAIRTVAIVKQEIVLDPASVNRQRITNDGVPKEWPLWSKGGTRIAFLKKVSEGVALGQVVVIDTSGKQVADFLVEPVTNGVAYAGMRAIESVQWLDETTIAVGGSINPSQSQYYVFRVGSREVQDFVDDGSAPAFSPDGHSLATVTSAPHWKKKGDQGSAVLEIASLAPLLKKIERYKVRAVVGGPVWSQDGKSLALLDRGQNAGDMRLFVRQARRKGQWIAAPTGLPADATLYWQAGALRVSTKDKSKSWNVSLANRKFVKVTGKVSRSSQEAGIQLRQQLLTKIQSDTAVKDADFWCADCPLTDLPRRVSNSD